MVWSFRIRSWTTIVLSLLIVLSVEAEDVVRKDFRGPIHELFFSNQAYGLLEGILTSHVHEVYPISGKHIFSERILRAHEVVFQPGSNLVFDNLDRVDGDYLAIVAKRLKFAEPREGHYTISRGDLVLPRGNDGDRGTNGANRRHADKGHDGAKGGSGGAGGDGHGGNSMDLPDLYIFADEIVLEGGGSVGSLNMSFIFDGIDGSGGGNGGPGGNGGRGGDGGEASIRWLSCKHEPRDGGPGGDAGIGGGPGNGGKGGDASDIIIVGPQPVVDSLSYSRFEIEPGRPGSGGARGPQGNPGSGGVHGHREFVCQRNSDDGPPGSVPNNPYPPRGGLGPDGTRGRVYMVTVLEVSPLLSVW